MACRGRRPPIEPHDDFLTYMTIDMQELGPRRDRRVPVLFMREEVLEMVDFAERYQAGIAVRVTTFEEPFLFLLSACQSASALS